MKKSGCLTVVVVFIAIGAISSLFPSKKENNPSNNSDKDNNKVVSSTVRHTSSYETSNSKETISVDLDEWYNNTYDAVRVFWNDIEGASSYKVEIKKKALGQL